MSDPISLLFLLFFVFAVAMPAFRQWRLNLARLGKIHALEHKRGTRVITLIHRQETLSFLGLPLYRFIDIDDSESILRAIRLTDPSKPIDLILHTPGGLVLAAEQIAHAIEEHSGPVTVLVPHYAMSGGTLIALAANQILMDENAVLGPVDPQLAYRESSAMPAASILAVISQKPRERLDDMTLILADVAAKAITQVEEFVYWLLQSKLGKERARLIARTLTEGRWTHDFPLTIPMLSQLGLPVATGLPQEVYELMELYPQTGQRRPSVEYIPVPYRGKEEERKRAA